MGFPRQELWSGSPFLSLRVLPDLGIKPASPAMQADCLLLSNQGSSTSKETLSKKKKKKSQYYLFLFEKFIEKSQDVIETVLSSAARVVTMFTLCPSDTVMVKNKTWLRFDLFCFLCNFLHILLLLRRTTAITLLAILKAFILVLLLIYRTLKIFIQFSHPVMSTSLWPNGVQHARPPCPSPTLRAWLNSSQLSRWY